MLQVRPGVVLVAPCSAALFPGGARRAGEGRRCPPQVTVPLEGKEAQSMVRLMEALEDHDDVQHVYANFDIPVEVLESLSGGA